MRSYSTTAHFHLRCINTSTTGHEAHEAWNKVLSPRTSIHNGFWAWWKTNMRIVGNTSALPYMRNDSRMKSIRYWWCVPLWDGSVYFPFLVDQPWQCQQKAHPEVIFSPVSVSFGWRFSAALGQCAYSASHTANKPTLVRKSWMRNDQRQDEKSSTGVTLDRWMGHIAI